MEEEAAELPWHNYPPYLRLYEKEENEDRLYLHQLHCGGELDLSGRHAERLQSLLSLYANLTSDMDRIRETIQVVHSGEEDWRGWMQPWIYNEMLDQELWKEFRLKWKIPRMVSFTLLEQLQGKLLKTMQSVENQPKYQQLCLAHLPPEIIDHIFFEAALNQARLLAATSKWFYVIGVPYIFHTRKMQFDCGQESAIFDLGDLPESERTPILTKLAAQKRQQLLDDIHFLLSRHDLTQALRNLTISNHWKQTRLRIRVLRDFQPSLDALFYAPMYQAISDLLNVCTSLAKLTISHFSVSVDWLCIVSLLSSLHSLHFHSSTITDSRIEEAILNGSVPLSPHIINVDIMECSRMYDTQETSLEWDGGGLWFTVLLFPNLVTFNYITAGIVSGALAPMDAIRSSSEIPHTALRRLFLGDIMCSQVPNFTSWFEMHCNTATPCTLTHLRLRTNCPLEDNLAIPLLQSIRSAPLQVLVLDGIKSGSLTLIRHITEFFPDLLGLTLILRQNNNNRDTRKYFAWNYHVRSHDPTPTVLFVFEQVACGKDIEDPTLGVLHYKPEYPEYFNDWEKIGLPFAAYCPTLEVLSMGHLMRNTCLISREPNGGIVVTPSRNLTEYRDWNPTDDSSGWKAVEPGKDKQELPK
ncbi:hypothetical protein D9758_001460 [Tetrapyrgos nigripes]|uniref:F-box domain-containing protein n=1 Tax=Tetrapyrgos nigripes TaxID=182062 RepID=A0A8H5GXV4_9AGAR|nr:hypothetical protein D9758_001460 [Tetrapyrgos nigripes]